MKARRSFYNIIFGLISQVFVIAFGVIIPRIFILKYGSEVNGFMSSINQIFLYMSLLEAGVGAATIQALYKPLTLDDKSSINGILSATCRYYKKTGEYYLIAVVAAAIIYPLFVKSEINGITMSAVILLTGLVGVLNFLFQAKYKLLLSAEGKTYIFTNITTIVTILTNVVKIVLIFLGYNIIIIQLVYCLISILQIIMVWMYINKSYKWLDLSVKPDYLAIAQKNSVLIHQISGMIFNNTDILILTVFCGFKIVSVYVMYNLIFQMVNSIISNINTGFVFVLGSAFFEDRDRFSKLYDSYELYYMAMVFAVFSITYLLILPFMKLYTAGITDINYIDYKLPVLFVIMNLMSYARMPGVNVIAVAGHFKETQYRSILESSINIIVSLICVKKFGMYGVLIGTIAALLYRTNDIIIYTSRYILKNKPWITYKRWLINTLLLFIIIYIANSIKVFPLSYAYFILTGLIMLLTIIPFYFIIVSLFDIKSFKYTLNSINIILENYKLKKKNY